MLKKEFKILTLGILSVAIVSIIGTVFIMNNFLATPSVTSITATSSDDTASLTYHSTVCKKVTRAGGIVEDLGCSKNLFTHMGMNFTAIQLAGTLAGSTNLTLHNTSINAIGIGVRGISNPACSLTQNASETYLCGELNTTCGMAKTAADAVRINSTVTPSAGNWTLTREFTSTCDGQAVNETGIFNSTGNQSGGQSVFFAQNTFSTATLNNNDKINVTWFIWVV